MINLMYVVLMAMLALNVSTEVLDGFSIVEESLKRTTNNSAKQNQAIMNGMATPEVAPTQPAPATTVPSVSLPVDSTLNAAPLTKSPK